MGDLLNWLDLLLLILIGLAAAKGFKRGFIVEICSFAALWIGVYMALHFSKLIAHWLDLQENNKITAFLITFLGVLLLVHVLARMLTTLINIVQMGWANRIAGIGAGMLRSAFMLSVMLNLLLAYTDNELPPLEARERSALHDPIRAFSPLLLPRLRETKWVKEMIEQLKEEAAGWTEGLQNGTQE
jgi:membrane protein required for colicin V production